MAIESLQCFKEGASYHYIHTIAHDLESLFYVVLWICTYYSGPRGKRRKFDKLPQLELWIELSASALAAQKRGQLDDFEDILKEIDPYFNDIKDVLRDFYKAIWKRDDMSDDDRARRVSSTVSHDDVITLLKKGIETLAKSDTEGVVRGSTLR